jgi:hypothetical protein
MFDLEASESFEGRLDHSCARMIKRPAVVLFVGGGDETMKHEALVEVARRRVAKLGNLDIVAAAASAVSAQRATALPHFGWPHVGVDPVATARVR